ncbi:MAG: DUF3944 domain-containing protein [Bacteroidaceae bacterium]|nr:DUF3944 domain-containing protein [Bacteroidaceae bacterium]
MLKKTSEIIAKGVNILVSQDSAPNSQKKKEVKVDSDLVFLSNCSNEQLQPLVGWIVYDPQDGKKRLRENLSKQKYFESNYKYHTKRLVPNIIEEIQGFGTNMLISGSQYRDVLKKVCDKLEVNYHPLISTERLEIELLKTIWDLEFEKLTMRDIEQISLELVRDYNKYTDGVLRGASYRVIIPCVLHIAFLRILTENNSSFTNDIN